jgi:hypothetical protein
LGPDRSPKEVTDVQPNRNAPPLLCSTGAIARGPQATAESRVLHYGPHLAVDALEVMIYASWYGRLDAIAGRFRAMCHPIRVTHGEKAIGPDLVADDGAVRTRAFARFEDNCRFTAAVGADRIVLHLWGLPDGDARVDQQLADLLRPARHRRAP